MEAQYEHHTAVYAHLHVLCMKTRLILPLRLVGFNSAFNTIRLYKHPSKGVYKQLSCQGIKRLNLETKIEKELQFLYVVQAQYEHRSAANTH